MKVTLLRAAFAFLLGYVLVMAFNVLAHSHEVAGCHHTHPHAVKSKVCQNHP